jgi:hypothetical protein
MELAVAQIRTLAQSADKADRKEILNTLSKLQSELEDPMETLMRLSNFVRVVSQEILYHANIPVEHTYCNVSHCC